MKRLSKKLIALLMAMTMGLAMGVTSFIYNVPERVGSIHRSNSFSKERIFLRKK
ncbi:MULTISPECIES: hypothetical protein [Anaerobutyricum]|uniref:hypothetical protein n=1 Tax=Anaerobutyricum TaxID=2569097 RepID=UPI0012FFD22D|nr:hypothetical protein [Anaerobutyricum hallii]